MVKIDKSKPVMITGATGYVASWIVKKLLEEGITVHAAVRDINNTEKLQYLDEIAGKSTGKLKYFEADLLIEDSYSEAMQDCELVFHTASPFINSVKNPQKDLIEPALLGTRNVLNSVNKTDTVKRVVLTSSCAAIFGDTKDILVIPNKEADENNWNTTSNLKHQPYSYSKTLAEKEAWKINKKQSNWDLVVINPTLVIGPGINPKITSESFNIIKQLGDGTTKMGAPGLDIGLVDVRDVADAHIKAGFTPEAEGRHLISAGHKTFLQMGQILKKEFGDKYPFPKKEFPKFIMWLIGPMFGVKRKMVKNNFGYPWLVNNKKSTEKLGINYISIEKSLIQFFQQMIDNKVFEKHS